MRVSKPSNRRSLATEARWTDRLRVRGFQALREADPSTSLSALARCPPAVQTGSAWRRCFIISRLDLPPVAHQRTLLAGAAKKPDCDAVRFVSPIFGEAFASSPRSPVIFVHLRSVSHPTLGAHRSQECRSDPTWRGPRLLEPNSAWSFPAICAPFNAERYSRRSRP